MLTGCTGNVAPYPAFPGIELDRCPHRAVAEDGAGQVNGVVRAWRAYTDHHMPPVTGGYMEQPAALMDAFAVLDGEQEAWRKECNPESS